jgi:hypothetical protein
LVNLKKLANWLFARHATPHERTQVEIQRVYTGLGAEFGQKLTYENITFALKREPVAHKIVFAVAHDIFDKWFEVEPLEEGVDKEKFNEKVQRVLLELDAKNVFTQAAVYERAYGWSIIVIGCKDRAPSLADPLLNPQEIVSLEPFTPTMISDVKINENEKSPRFGLPEIYKIKITETSEVEVHYSRVIHFATRKIEPGYKGISVLEPVWDDLTVLRNIRWGMGQTMYRYGSGFPVVTIKGATKEDLKDYQSEWGPLYARTSLWCDENTTIEFKGLAGRALDPEPYYTPIMENISAGTGIPMPILRGAQAGTLAGSEVNEREYFKLISDCQSRYEPGIMELIDRLMETGQLPDMHYRIKWLGGFQINPRDEAATELDKNRSLQVRSNWLTVNELRKLEGLDPIPGGDVVLGLLRFATVAQAKPTVIQRTSKRKLELERKFGKPWDELLLERVNQGDSVNKICRDLGISTSTFYQWMEEIQAHEKPIVVYKREPELIKLLQSLTAPKPKPTRKHIKKTLTDEEGQKITEETIVEVEY